MCILYLFIICVLFLKLKNKNTFESVYLNTFMSSLCLSHYVSISYRDQRQNQKPELNWLRKAKTLLWSVAAVSSRAGHSWGPSLWEGHASSKWVLKRRNVHNFCALLLCEAELLRQLAFSAARCLRRPTKGQFLHRSKLMTGCHLCFLCVQDLTTGAKQEAAVISVLLQKEPIFHFGWITVILMIPLLKISFILQQLTCKYDYFFPMSLFQVVWIPINHFNRKLRSVIWIFLP